MMKAIDSFSLALRGISGLLPALLFTLPTSAQDFYQTAMLGLASEIREKVSEHSATNILVSPMKRLDGLECELGRTITLDLEAALAQGKRSYRLLDRLNLEALESEHRLELEGWMDAEQRMREAGKLLKAEVMVFGYYTYTGELLLLHVKAVDIQTSEQLVVLSAASRPDVIIRSLCGPVVQSNSDEFDLELITTIKLEQEQGSPLVMFADPGEAADADCAIRKFGTYCFRNEGEKDLKVLSRFPIALDETRSSSLLVRMGRTECFYSKPAGSYDFTVHEVSIPEDPSLPIEKERIVAQGMLNFDPCTIGQMVYP